MFLVSKIAGFFAIPSNLIILVGIFGALLLRTRLARAGLRLVIAPRFIAQAAVVERECAARGVRAGRVSRGAAAGADVIILDTYGDLPRVSGWDFLSILIEQQEV